MKRIITSLCLLLLCTSLFAGPFGIEFGMTKNEIEKHGKLTEISSNDFYSTYSFVPEKKHSLFSSYSLLIGKDEGLVKLIATTATISDTGYGTSTKSKYKEIKTSLEKTYGKPTEEYDFNSSKTWTDPDDWMMSLKLGYRYLTCYWDTKDERGIGLTVYIDANAKSSSSSTITLGYESAKFYEVKDKQEKSESNLF